MRINYRAALADHMAGACVTAGDNNLFDDATTADDILGDRTSWSGFNGRDALTDREWRALVRAAERWLERRA